VAKRPRARNAPPTPPVEARASDPGAELARLAAQHAQGAVVVLDHLDGAVTSATEEQQLVAAMADLLTRLARAAGERVRFLLVAESTRMSWVGALEQRLGAAVAPQARMVLARFDTQTAADVIERTVLAGGVWFEQGLASD